MKEPPKGALKMSSEGELDVEQDVEQEVEQDVEQDVEVILVVKGAGLHQPGDVLQQFLRGFWPAVNAATMREGVPQTANTMRLLDLEAYNPPAHVDKKQAKLVEIGLDPLPGSQIDLSTNHVWIKEAYWELGGQPPGAWRSLLNEWRMASYALTSEFSGWLKAIPLRLFDRIKKIITRRSSGSSIDPPAFINWTDRWVDSLNGWFSGLEFVYNFMSYWLFYTLLLSMVFLVIDSINVVEQGSWFKSAFNCDANLFTETLCFGPTAHPARIGFLVAALLALLLSWAPAYRLTTNDPASSIRNPGLHPIVLALMIVAFIWNIWLYIGFILLLVAPIVIGNFNRLLWWKFRLDSNTDRPYHRFRRDAAGKTELLHIYPDLVLYRLIVLWFLPIATLALLLAKFLILTRILGGFGRTLELWINNLLGGLLGDVSMYAMDPSTAVQVRSAVEYEIKYFDDIERVRHIHVFAHSQGTPVSFETLFTHMPKTYRRKIKTYVTIGSVLGLYNVIEPILDEVPVPSRFRKTDYSVETFAPGFRWFNCWNLADNITSFYGLDAFDKKLREGGDTTGALRLPTNIRTRTKGHSEYWSNLKEVQGPFARRVIEDVIDEKWTLGRVERTLRHAVYEVMTWLVLVVGLVSLVRLLTPWMIAFLLKTQNLNLWELLSQLVGLLRQIDFIQPIIDTIGDWLSPIGAVLNNDPQRASWIMIILIVFGLFQVARNIRVWWASKLSLPEEA